VVFENMNILVVDDQKVIGDLFKVTLGSGGHSISATCGSQEALECVRKERFDVAFIDMVMPDKDGIEVLKEIWEISSDLPVVMMSGYSVEDKKKEAVRMGSKAFLKKPFEINDIKRVIKEATGKDI